MKKFKLFLFFCIALLLLPVTAILAQVGTDPVIPDWQYLYDNFGTLMFSYLGIAAIASFLGEAIVRLIKATGAVVKIVVVMVLGIGISFLGQVANIGYLAESIWWQTALWGVLSGIAANGMRSSNLIFFKTIIDFIIGLVLSKEPNK